MTAHADDVVVAWVSAQVLPLETELRRWLRGVCREPGEVDDLIQDIYYRLLKLPSVEHIGEPRAYIFQMARNIRIDQIRRKTVVSIETAQNLEDLDLGDGNPSPERIALARAELKWVMGLINDLPTRCKRVFELRKVYGLSQAETAESLCLTENIVEKETSRGLVLISDMIKRVTLGGKRAAAQKTERQKPVKVANVKH